MNILPKKSWHVRNKDNIARVRRDEAEAAEEDRKRRKRVDLAEQEARTDFLRKKASLSLPDTSSNDELAVVKLVKESTHINFFQDVKDCKGTSQGNREYEEEKHREKEQREKALGILTYLGQSASEAQTSRPWYQNAPIRSKMDVDDSMKDEKLKRNLDPLYEMEKCLHRKSGEKKKYSERKHKKSKTIKEERPLKTSIEQLRQERLKREVAERTRAETLMSVRKNSSNPKTEMDEQEMDDRRRLYNSQFNPQIARKPRLREELWRRGLN
ncbi:PREDICTED: leukocyte receptor cluster member 1 [Nanorana parkeri]|uniref:leukocyte receptor cluster member 1 n=1 Tax=Nanorana parkeri TaxID=125878 RepID=UPI000854404E|nr:PREDICTED: leukocyte receptor cluster member 1 [Nanorana parkeri]